MTEPRCEVEDSVENAMEMLGVGYPVIQFEKPGKQILETESGYEVAQSLGWVKFSTYFRNSMLAKLKGAKLSVFMCICLHVNESGAAFPGIDTIARETDLHRDTVMDTIAELETMPGLLDVIRKRGKKNIYRPYYAARGKNNEPKIPVDVLPTRPVDEVVDVSPTPVVDVSPTLSRVEEEDKEYKPNIKKAKQRKAEQQAKRQERGGVLGGIMHFADSVEKVTAMRRRVEDALNAKLAREWDKKHGDWYGYEKELIRIEEETGETIEQFMVWFISDDFRKGQVMYLTPAKIDKYWNKAFAKHELAQANEDGSIYA